MSGAGVTGVIGLIIRSPSDDGAAVENGAVGCGKAVGATGAGSVGAVGVAIGGLSGSVIGGVGGTEGAPVIGITGSGLAGDTGPGAGAAIGVEVGPVTGIIGVTTGLGGTGAAGGVG